jgi:hypothetical protein
MLKNAKFLALALTAALSACGGGGGSSGTVSADYQISLRADKTLLPLNVAGSPAGIGVYAPFTTTLYVQASVGGQPIPGGTGIFGCNLVQGLESGALYYLDGNSEHEDATTKAPLAYRAVTLDSNSGAASFHFHSGAKAGTARITCSVTDPRDKQQKSASVDIAVGGATGQAASISAIAAYPTLGTQGNLNNVRTSTAIEAHVLDDANQPVPAPTKANLQVAVVSSAAATGARLLAGVQSGSVVQVSTVGGVGLFSLASGPNEGTILLQMTADRFDNDVTNGIQDPIIQLLAVSVTAGNPAAPATDPLALVNVTPPAGTNGLPYSYAFSAKGGVAPYTWAALGGLPDGLNLSSSGILSGTPVVKQPGVFNIAVRVTDSQGASITGNFALTIAPTAGTDPATNVLSINLSGCGSDVNTACSLSIPNPTTPAPVPAPAYYYQYVLSVTGPGTGNATWAMTQNPAWLALDGTNGILSIAWADAVAAPALKDCTSGAFFITATRAGVSTMRKVQLVIGSGAGACKP